MFVVNSRSRFRSMVERGQMKVKKDRVKSKSGDLRGCFYKSIFYSQKIKQFCQNKF